MRVESQLRHSADMATSLTRHEQDQEQEQEQEQEQVLGRVEAVFLPAYW